MLLYSNTYFHRKSTETFLLFMRLIICVCIFEMFYFFENINIGSRGVQG